MEVFLHNKSFEVIGASGQDTFWKPPWGGVFYMSQEENALRQNQGLLERLSIFVALERSRFGDKKKRDESKFDIKRWKCLSSTT